MANRVLDSVEVSAGMVVSGRYKRPNRDSVIVSLEVDRCLSVPNRFGTAVPYLAGTRKNGSQTGLVMALRADCFYPVGLDITVEDGFKPLEGAYFVNPSIDPMFGFFEELEHEVDIVECIENGGIPAVDVTVPYHELPIVVDTDSEEVA